jgi:hypothetical protein
MDEQVTWDIIAEVARAEGVTPSEIECSLQEYVDLDAIATLVEHDGALWTFTFALPDYEVTVRHDGTVAVSETETGDRSLRKVG